MSEADLIARTDKPGTRESLAADLAGLGLKTGDTVIVHSSLSKLGWLAGGPVAAIQALLDALGPKGTLVMPAHSSDLTDPANWRAPPVPSDWVEIIRANMPAYDPRTTPTRHMGQIAELDEVGLIRVEQLDEVALMRDSAPLVEAPLAWEEHSRDDALSSGTLLACPFTKRHPGRAWPSTCIGFLCTIPRLMNPNEFPGTVVHIDR
jgi:hypothetical protein